MCVGGRQIRELFPFFGRVKGEALFCSRACHRPATGFNFNPLSTSATQLLPAAIYYRKIERIQGVCPFLLALNVQACYLFFFSSIIYVTGAPACPPCGPVGAAVIVTKSSGKKEGGGGICRISKAKREDGSGPIN